jgi:hypothetical protein
MLNRNQSLVFPQYTPDKMKVILQIKRFEIVKVLTTLTSNGWSNALLGQNVDFAYMRSVLRT